MAVKVVRVAVLIPAAGSGERMGAQVPKVFLDLGGVPIIIRTLAAFAGVSGVVQRIVVLAKEVRAKLPVGVATSLAGDPSVRLVDGGARRQDSVRRGLDAVESDVDIVMVHDAARPLVRRADVQAVLAAAARSGAAVLAIPATDTIKRVAEGLVVETLSRQGLWLAQTPQAFRADWLREAHARAAKDEVTGTDDAALVERCGHPVAVVPGSATNLKITTPDDLTLARALVSGRQGPGSSGE